MTTQFPLFGELLERLRLNWRALPDKPDETPENTLRALWLRAANEPVSIPRLDGHDLPVLNAAAQTHLWELVNQRVKGTPLAHLTNRQDFFGIEFLASSEAMIPRKETEILAGAALGTLRRLVQARGHVRVVDLCAGSGNVSLALAAHEPNCSVIGADISPDAVRLARRNAEHLGLSHRARFLQSDLLSAFSASEFAGQVDLITCNPPYISSARTEELPLEIAEHESKLAFDGGPLGVKILTRVIREAPRYLKPESWLAMEVGVGQDKAVARWLERSRAFEDVEVHHDSEGRVRAIVARTVGTAWRARAIDDGHRPGGSRLFQLCEQDEKLLSGDETPNLVEVAPVGREFGC